MVKLHSILDEAELLAVGAEHAVLHLAEQVRGEALLKGESWLPNEWHASDHLPVGAALALAPIA